MTSSRTNVLDRITDLPSVPEHGAIARDFTEPIDLEIPRLPDRIQVQEMPRVGAEDADREAEAIQVLFVSLTLLALFVLIFVGYLVLAVAQLL
ncbi:MAG TPA: hypothetical protein VIO57_05625 [Chloroflexota bacterium]|jgi:hypothetical protein